MNNPLISTEQEIQEDATLQDEEEEKKEADLPS